MNRANLKFLVSGLLAGSLLTSGVAMAAPKLVKLIVNGNEVRSEVPAQIIDGSTLVPARALANALGAKVSWDDATQTVTIENEAYRQQQRKKATMTERDAAGLVGDAKTHFWYMARGGDGDRKEETFSIQGKDYPYRWMSSTLDTKTKYIEYIEQLFTSEQAEAYWKKLSASGLIVEVDGKLAQQAADGGSLVAWGEATAQVVSQDSGAATFRFRVPVGDDYETKDFKMKYVEGKGWRIDEPVDAIR